MTSEKEESVQVREIMTKGVVYLDASKTADDAAKLMNENKVGCVVIMENLIVVGIVTERDLVRRVLALNKPSSTKIKEVMSSPIVVINPDESISELAQLMRDRKIHKVPVISPPEKIESQLVGIVTDTDLICYSSRGSTSKMTEIIDQICLRKSN